MPRASAPARMRISTSSPCCSKAEEAGLELLDKDGRWLAILPARGRDGGQCRRYAAAPDQPCSAPRPRTASSTRRPSAAAIRAMLHALLPPSRARFSGSRRCRAASPRKIPNRYPTPITAHDYFHERLVEIGLVKKGKSDLGKK